jgi:broad specificity phosphatase PhoE
MRIFCLRHGESANVLARTAGVLPQAPLTPVGRRQAHAAADILAGEPVAAIYSSTAVRAADTAGIIGRTHGLKTVCQAELLEVGIGSAEGSADPAIGALTAAVLRGWIVDGQLDARVGDGESGSEVVARVGSALAKIAAAHPGGTVVVVGHVASLTVALNQLCGLGGAPWGAPLPHAVPFLVEHDDGGWRCDSWPPPHQPAAADA